MQITICLYPQFSNHCLANALEPLRAANDLSGRGITAWQIVSPRGTPVRSSSGLRSRPRPAWIKRGGCVVLDTVLCRARVHRGALRHHLQRAAMRHGLVVGMDMGGWLMAAAGLLEGRRATVHWDEYAAFAELSGGRAQPDRVVHDGDPGGHAAARPRPLTWS